MTEWKNPDCLSGGFWRERSSGLRGRFWPGSLDYLVETGYLPGASQLRAQILRRGSKKKCADLATSEGSGASKTLGDLSDLQATHLVFEGAQRNP